MASERDLECPSVPSVSREEFEAIWGLTQPSTPGSVSQTNSPKAYPGSKLTSWRTLTCGHGGAKCSDWTSDSRATDEEVRGGPTRLRSDAGSMVGSVQGQHPGVQRYATFAGRAAHRPAVLELPPEIYLDPDGGQTPVRHFRDRANGWGIGFTEDGRVLIAHNQPDPWKVDIDDGDEEEAVNESPSERPEFVQLGPKAQEDGSHLQQLEEMFQSVDGNRDGRITKDELRKALLSSAETNKVTLQHEVLEEIVTLIFEEADVDGDGMIELRGLAMLMYGKEAVTPSSAKLTKTSTFLHRAFSGRSWSREAGSDPIDTMALRPSGSDWMKGLLFSRRFRQEACFFLLNNWQPAWVLLAWLAINGAVFVHRFYQMNQHPAQPLLGIALNIAKGGAAIVKLNIALLLFSVCRWTISFLRSTILRYVIPFDESLEFHKLTVVMIVIGSLIHTGAFLFGNYLHIASASESEFQHFLGASFNHKQPSYADLLHSRDATTGWVLWLVLVLFGLLSPNRMRQALSKSCFTQRLGSFNFFWFTHLLLFPLFFVVCFYHGSQLDFAHFPTVDTWKFMAGPLGLYLLEKVLRVFSTQVGRLALDVIQVEILPGNVLSLHLSNPPFKFQSGAYVFIRCPAVAMFEWHPFSITSAPSDFELTVHIRACGDWTQAMLDFWRQEKRKGESLGAVNAAGEIIVGAFASREMPLRRYHYPRVLVDGPHGSPTQDYESFRVIMLIGAGIGVTPMASVVRDVLHKSKHRRKYPQFNVEKVHFFWTTREQGSFEWFRGLMAQAAAEDSAGVVDMHNYLTSAYGDDDPRSFLLKAAKDKYHAKTGHDIIANTKTKISTHFARPDWDAIFAKVLEKTPHTAIGVFFCGLPALEKELRVCCHRHTMQATNGTSFIFRKENF